MKYELAKELKDAGFDGRMCPWVYYRLSTLPREEHQVLRVKGTLTGYSPDEVIGDVAAPTLSELIEACGDDFVSLIKHDDKSGWTALKTGDILFNQESNALGATPEIAVAKLWLALTSRGKR